MLLSLINMQPFEILLLRISLFVFYGHANQLFAVDIIF